MVNFLPSATVKKAFLMNTVCIIFTFMLINNRKKGIIHSSTNTKAFWKMKFFFCVCYCQCVLPLTHFKLKGILLIIVKLGGFEINFF